MGLLQSYSTFIINHPAKIIVANIFIIITLLIITILVKPWPSFKDPRVGLEARNTLISSRINAWKLLVDETSASQNNLSLNPNNPHYEISFHHNNQNSVFDKNLISNELNNSLSEYIEETLNEPPVIEMSMDNVQGVKNNSINNEQELDEDEDEYYRNVKSAANDRATLMHYSPDSNKAFCGQLFEGYSQIVVTPSAKQSQAGLFNLNSMISICQLDHKLRLELSSKDKLVFQNDCERFRVNETIDKDPLQTGSACCNSWSLPNYIACLSNHTSCFALKTKDLKNFEDLLYLCTPYYYKTPFEECFVRSKDATHDLGSSNYNLLHPPTHETDHVIDPAYCGQIPEKCLRCGGWVYFVMHYLVNQNLMQSRNESNLNKMSNRFDRFLMSSKLNTTLNKLTYTNIFLPVAKSPSLMVYYQTLSKYNLKTPFATVKAMDLGLRNVLFEHLLHEDAKLFMTALLAIFIVITLHTWSIILSMTMMLIICLSLSLSFIVYELILDIPIFPFMNLLAVVISFGICSDNAMLFCKQWPIERVDVPVQTVPDAEVVNGVSREINARIQETTSNEIGNNVPKPCKDNNPVNKEKNALDSMLKRAILTTSVATSATACSFVISAISKITAVRCFCIFATLSVLTNYILIVILLPPALILNMRLSIVMNSMIRSRPKYSNILDKLQHLRNRMIEVSKWNNKLILNTITNLKYYLIITFVTILCCSSILVFYRPTLQPTDEDRIQLLSTKHPFEQYDRNVRNHFGFEKHRDRAYSMDTLPVRVVFGIEPQDNGDIFESHDRGSLVFDRTFDLADSKAQTWMLEFCKKLKQQKFIKQTADLDWSSCFIDSFKTWMGSRPCRDPVQQEIDRSPCCQNYEFPFSRKTFNKCVGEAVNIIRKTPHNDANINAGIRFFKNSTQVAAIIIEYPSTKNFSGSFKKMDRFFTDVDDWVTWQINNTAPPSLKSGWFISSNLDWLALQNELLDSTTLSIILEVLFAMIALLVSTRDLIITIAGTITIGTIITMTIASLILLRWTLGVAESIMISLTIGLSIDFALHYSVAYSERKKNGSNDAVIHSVLDQVGGPITLAAITTSVAGFVIVWSDILAYQELGIFLMLIAIISWINSTFFLLPMLASINQNWMEFFKSFPDEFMTIL